MSSKLIHIQVDYVYVVLDIDCSHNQLVCSVQHDYVLRLLLGAEAPVMTPNGADFSVLLLF